MAPTKDVPRLKEIAKDKVLFMVCEIIIRDLYINNSETLHLFGVEPVPLSPAIEIARAFILSNLSSDLLENILNEILDKDEAVETSVRYTALQLLLAKGIRYLKIGHFPEAFYGVVLDAITDSCADLERLDLNGLWIRERDKLSFCRLIRRLHKIHHLTIKYVCDDEILAIIGKHCNEIEVLDIIGSKNITENGIDEFINNPFKTKPGYKSDICSTLKIFNLGGPGAQRLQVNIGVKILQHFPHLKSIGAFEKTSQAINHLFRYNPNLKLKLEYIHDIKTSSENLLAMLQASPEIRAIYLDTPGCKAVQSLHLFAHLSEVKLHKVKSEDVNIMLNKCGCRIKGLYLLNVYGTMNINHLLDYCPNIVRLDLQYVDLSCGEYDPNKLSLKLVELHIFYSKITIFLFKFIIDQCPNLETLSLGECTQLTDENVLDSITKDCLQNIKSIWFGLADNLTMLTLNKCIEHCPKLTNIGNLAAWDIVQEEADFLRSQIALLNVDLTLHEYGPQEQAV